MVKLFNKRFVSAIAAATMVVSMSASAFAVTTDPNMTAYDTAFTTAVTISETEAQPVPLKAVPADANYTATAFSTEDDAYDATWSLVDGSTSGVTISDDLKWYEEITGGYAATNTATVVADAEPGAASIKVVNPNSNPANAYVNLTVVANGTVQNEADGNKNTASNVTYRFYNGSSLLLEQALTVDAASYNSNILYPTALDGVAGLDAASDNLAATILNYGSPYISGITINGQTYNTESWLYGVYEKTSDTRYDLIPLSEAVGMDNMDLENDYMVVLKYGPYGSVSFDSSITVTAE